jgi:replicative DNA helicase
MTKSKTEKEVGLSSYVFGQLPPQALELEEAVLGAILLDKNAMVEILDILTAESFYSEKHSTIFRACLRLFEKSHPIDLLTVMNELIRVGELDLIGGAFSLNEVTNRVGSSANLEFHARIVQQKAMERELIKVSGEVIRDAYDPTVDTFDVIESAERKVFNVTQGGFIKATKSTGQIGSEFLKQLEEARKSKEGLTGIPSGFTSIDRVTCGWQKTDLIIVAARPGMGKSAFMLSTALGAAKIEKPVAIFSLEMSRTQLFGRIASQEGSIEGYKLKSGKMDDMDWQKLHKVIEQISEMPIYIDDTPSLSIYELRAKCRRLKMQHDIQLVVVDYLQLMTAGTEKTGNRDQEIGKISGGLKALAKELNVPVIALSQLSRAVETRGGTKRPMLSDLRESGNVEQDADIVSFIYRPEYYQILQDENGNSTVGVAEYIIAKHRSGSIETVELKFIDKYTQFLDKDEAFFLGNEKPSQYEYLEPFEPTKTQVTPSKINDGEDIPF